MREAVDLPLDVPAGCLLTLAEERLGVPVNVSRMPEGVEGLCWRLGDGPPMLWVNAHDVVPRRRFTLAHELGHIRCGHDTSLILETYETVGGKPTSNAEVQANAFAAELLAPAAGVRAMVAGDEATLEEVVRIAARFGVSIYVAAYRCVTLKLVPFDNDLKAAIDNGEHRLIWEALDEPEDDDEEDRLAGLTTDALPRLSPLIVDSGLAALVRGEASVEDVAAGCGVGPATLAGALALLGV